MKCVYMAFVDLEKAYYRVDRKARWQVLQIYAGNGVLGRAEKSFYEKSKPNMSLCKEERYFEVAVGLRPGLVMSS